MIDRLKSHFKLLNRTTDRVDISRDGDKLLVNEAAVKSSSSAGGVPENIPDGGVSGL